ncbi:hypothetical protein [Amycolatopsis sp. SID8362]|uniref:hypothetical protein n=1 Tax=Amycolatopsis sp. SID8362 TaxID=2690346 RepID=UPI001370D8BA|nr:hypothetical protein [Amycolatopsis sp. SID8362]NBH08574.1 hypothetical protein [Amycolatopsis sp. SID8362]NED45268.1 hypothetical protein [Amycolatopsis sp. SID8362]
MNADARVLAYPVTSVAELLGRMRRTLASRPFDPATMFLDPDETRRFPSRSAQLRLSVLLRTYRGDYHTDSFEFGRLGEQIRRGDEHIWFWGAPGQIAAARAELHKPDVAELPDLALGTVTVLSAEHEFGPGHGELCRSGSMDATVGAVAAILHRMIGYHSGTDRGVHDRYHTLLLAARNRKTVPPVRGGEAVQHIHCTHVRSQHWGIVPFYVMQGGVLECTELREAHRDPDVVRRAVPASTPWWFADADDAAFAEALTRLNLAAPAGVRVARSRARPSPARSTVIAPQSTELIAANHVTVRPERAGDADALPFPDAVRAAESLGCCTVAVRLPLDDPDRTADQNWLAQAGFTLTAISPPKRSWQTVAGTKRDLTTPPTGIWCRIRPDLHLAPPHYLNRPGADEDEAAVLDHLRRRISTLRADR